MDMLFFNTRIGNSAIADRGLFAKELIPAGSVVGNLSHKVTYISELDYSDAQKSGDERVIHTGIRLAGSKFMYNRPAKSGKFLYQNEDFINHSEKPSMLYHCGLLFSL